ncbi:MAG: hypothetical protein R3C45_11855 [Phycisphaerales bacterium]
MTQQLTNAASQQPATTLKVFGLQYTHLRTECGGDLWVTQYGLPMLDYLKPERWYTNNYYCEHGERLGKSTGTVYRVRPRNAPAHCQLVVKFSRIGQEVPLVIDPDFPDDISELDMHGARFNSPWEEFDLVEELRKDGYGSDNTLIRTQRPLAIYAPSEQFELWRLGRSDSRLSPHLYKLKQDQARYPLAVELDIKRDYIVLYGWVKGIDAVVARDRRLISENELTELTITVITELRSKGFRVLDNKPDHFILRADPDTGRIARRNNKLVYALIDFELLQRTATGQQVYRDRQREHYFKSLAMRVPTSPQSAGVQTTRIMGVNYCYGRAPNGGQVWAVGDNPELMGYFQPDRWRRTPRIQLSLGSEVYRTRTRDDIHIVYRMSKVGQRPNADPFYDRGKRIREYGYNSPFEEIAAAEKLRARGIPTVHPRAIYRTGHMTSRARHLQDPGRAQTHAKFITPENPPEPILSEHHDYYTLWGQWRGIDPLWMAGSQGNPGRLGFIDADRALSSRLLSPTEVNQSISGSRKQLILAGCDETLLDDHQFLFIFDSRGNLQRNRLGSYDVALAFDALTSLNYGLISEDTYVYLIEDMANRLKTAGFEALNLTGSHLLLSFDTHGNLRVNDLGERETALCSFDLITPLDENDAFRNQT